jgi:hypothetical protein
VILNSEDASRRSGLGAEGELKILKLMFLKLEGLRGPSFAPRHIGDFEVSSYTWSHQPILRAGPSGLAEATFNYLQVYKRTDTSSESLKLAWTKEQVFATGDLIEEEVSAAGHLIRTTAFKMRSIVLATMSSFRYEDMIALKFESMNVVR